MQSSWGGRLALQSGRQAALWPQRQGRPRTKANLEDHWAWGWFTVIFLVEGIAPRGSGFMEEESAVGPRAGAGLAVCYMRQEMLTLTGPDSASILKGTFGALTLAPVVP